jgi:septal ring factor EnvC (AmiA/AmiB activator)
MTDQLDLDKTLEELRKLLHEYSDLAIDFAAQHNLTEHAHQIHELKAKLDHLKYLLAEQQNNDEMNNKNFLNHHAMALQHAIGHHFLMEQELAIAAADAEAFEEEMRELKEVYKELWQMYERLREQQEMKQHLEQQTLANATPYPSPFGSHRDEE